MAILKSGLDFGRIGLPYNGDKWASVTEHLVQGGYVPAPYEKRDDDTATQAVNDFINLFFDSSAYISTDYVDYVGSITAGNHEKISNSAFTLQSMKRELEQKDAALSCCHKIIDDLKLEIQSLKSDKTHETFSTDENFDALSAYDRAMSSLSKI